MSIGYLALLSSLATERYVGKSVAKIKKTGIVKLLPKGTAL